MADLCYPFGLGIVSLSQQFRVNFIDAITSHRVQHMIPYLVYNPREIIIELNYRKQEIPLW